MSRLRRRPSPALVVAFLALLVALGGSAGADPVAFVAKTIKGKTIKKGSVPGNRLKKNSLTGTQIRESKLATVPRAKAAATAKLADSAKTATTAGSATSAATAGTATTASSAERAKGLDGYAPWTTRRLTPTDGATAAAAREAAPRVPLGTTGPFSFYAKCFRDPAASKAYGEVYVETGVSGSILMGDDYRVGFPQFLDTSTLETDRQLIDIEAGPNEVDGYLDGFTVIPPTGAGVAGYVSMTVRQGTASTGGPFGDGDGCVTGGLTLVG